MSVNKNFVVRHGLEVSSDLILANSTTRKVGIGSTSPQYTLDVRGGIGATTINITGIGTIVTFQSTTGTITNLSGTNLNVSGIGTIGTFQSTTGTITNLSGTNLNVSGVVTATDFNSSSDFNLKDNIKIINDPLAKVLQLNGVSFDWKDTQQSSAGVIAQDVEKVLPSIVHDNSTGYKSLNYNGLIGLLIEAVKELSSEVKELKSKLNT